MHFILIENIEHLCDVLCENESRRDFDAFGTTNVSVLDRLMS